MVLSRFVSTAIVVSVVVASGCIKRGTWWWWDRKAAPQYGIEEFRDGKIGKTKNVQAEDVISELTGCRIRHVYGGYKELWDTYQDQEWIARWNEALHAARKESWLLMADSTWLTNKDSLIKKLEERLGPWYSQDPPPIGLKSESFFDGIHLDVEPVVYKECKEEKNKRDPDECYQRLVDLKTLLEDVRKWIDTKAPNLKLTIDVNDWFDDVHDDDIQKKSRVKWQTDPGQTEKEACTDWYQQIALLVDGITVMTKYDDTVKVKARSSWEREHVPVLGERKLGKKVLRPSVRVGIYIEELPDLRGAAKGLEKDGVRYIDLYSFNELLMHGHCGGRLKQVGP